MLQGVAVSLGARTLNAVPPPPPIVAIMVIAITESWTLRIRQVLIGQRHCLLHGPEWAEHTWGNRISLGVFLNMSIDT